MSEKGKQKCELCGGYDVATAAVEIRGRIKWICYKCYKERNK